MPRNERRLQFKRALVIAGAGVVVMVGSFVGLQFVEVLGPWYMPLLGLALVGIATVASQLPFFPMRWEGLIERRDD